jgi:hypothetical protein
MKGILPCILSGILLIPYISKGVSNDVPLPQDKNTAIQWVKSQRQKIGSALSQDPVGYFKGMRTVLGTVAGYGEKDEYYVPVALDLAKELLKTNLDKLPFEHAPFFIDQQVGVCTSVVNMSNGNKELTFPQKMMTARLVADFLFKIRGEIIPNYQIKGDDGDHYSEKAKLNTYSDSKQQALQSCKRRVSLMLVTYLDTNARGMNELRPEVEGVLKEAGLSEAEKQKALSRIFP